MKTRKIILVLTVLIGFSAFSQDTIIDYRSQLELIADELDISEKDAYNSLVLHQRIQAYRNLTIFITMFLSAFATRKYLNRGTKDLKERQKEAESYEMPKEMSAKFVAPITISICLFIASVVYNSVTLSDTFTGLFNPEYGALEQLEFLKR